MGRQGIVLEMDVVVRQPVVASLVTVVPPRRQQLVLTRDTPALLVGELPEPRQLKDEFLKRIGHPQVTSACPRSCWLAD